MNIYAEFKRIYSSFQEMVGLRRKKAAKHQLQIVQSPLSV